jgi:predicted type IV restriction endonuclease
MMIVSAVAEALEHSKSPPPNESNTCEWIILPLLYAIGYAKREVVSRDADIAGKFPDYTLLPNEPQHTFYLEAKACKVNLEDGHANQALNYANQNGKRWVVLTNGREWRLYDNDIRGLAADKLAAQARIENTDQATRFLESIGKASVCSDRLEEFVREEQDRKARLKEEQRRLEQETARRDRLKAVLDAELKDEAGALIAAVLRYLRDAKGLADVNAQDVALYFGGRAGSVVAPPVPPPLPQPAGITLVIAARDAWSDYQRFSAYMCQPKRKFRSTSHIAFYTRKAIEPRVPRILGIVEEVELSEHGVCAIPDLDEPTRTRLLALVGQLSNEREMRHLNQKRKVLLLSPPESGETILLPHRIVHDRPTAFTQGQRYVQLSRLQAAPKTTSELVAR